MSGAIATSGLHLHLFLLMLVTCSFVGYFACWALCYFKTVLSALQKPLETYFD